MVTHRTILPYAMRSATGRRPATAIWHRCIHLSATDVDIGFLDIAYVPVA